MIRACFAWLMMAGVAFAQVTVDPDSVAVRDGWFTLEIEMNLSAVTPYRAFVLDNPPRLVVDFQDVRFDGVDPAQVVSGDRALAVRFGPLRPDWSRMVVDLAEPFVPDAVGLTATENGAALRIVMSPADAATFAARAGAPPDPGWDVVSGFDPVVAAAIAQSDDFVVVLDAGHGGIDPGANQGGIKEADLMLILAQETAVKLNALDGVQAVLTRDSDEFVPLSTRLTIARQVGADVFLSLHADALPEDAARGASIYTLSEDGSDAAALRHVERHERGDLLAGVDLETADDRIATALMDLARAQTGPEGRRIANALVAAMTRAGVVMNKNPRRSGQFAVLTAADFPSVLIEAGFLSNPEDRAILATPAGRARLSTAIVETVSLLAR